VTVGHETPLVWHDDAYVPEGPWPPGCAFFAPPDSIYADFMLSDHYRENVAQHRRPIVVTIPTDRKYCVAFCVDSHPTAEEKRHEAWEVTIDESTFVNGERPLITVKPSIHIIGYYHGWLTDGVLSDG